MTHRKERVSSLILREVSEIIERDLQDPRLGFVTVTGVKITSDLRHATIFITVHGTEEERKETLAVLNSARGYIRREFGRRVRLKYTPEIDFEYDNTFEEMERINKLFESLEENSG